MAKFRAAINQAQDTKIQISLLILVQDRLTIISCVKIWPSYLLLNKLCPVQLSTFRLIWRHWAFFEKMKLRWFIHNYLVAFIQIQHSAFDSSHMSSFKPSITRLLRSVSGRSRVSWCGVWSRPGLATPWARPSWCTAARVSGGPAPSAH